MEFKDYYQMLGVDRNVTADELKKAFRKLARKYHPDISKEADAELRMKEINEAYAVLSDPEKRAAYDQIGQGARPGQDFRPPPDWDAGFEFSGGPSPHETADFSEFFTELFGRMNGGQPGRRSAHARPRGRGEDHHAKVLLDLEDAFNGATRQITLRVPQLDDQGRVALATRTLNVKIPVGVRAGQIIRLAGQGAGGLGAGGLGADGLGADGPGAAPAGDLLLEVQFRPHPRFQVDGRDLHMPLPVTPWEAALGGVVTVELPHGNVKVRIPAGAQGGRQVRVRGKGLPGEPAGDLLLELQVVLPPADTPQARTLYETMARELAFDPRQSPKG